MADTQVPLTNYLGGDGKRPTATVNKPSNVTATAVRTAPDTATTSGVFLDNFTVEESLLLLPDTAETSGVVMDDFSVEVGYIIEPDTIELTTEMPRPSSPLQFPITSIPTVQMVVEIPTPSIFYQSDSNTATPLTVELTTTIGSVGLERGVARYEFTGDLLGFALVPNCSIIINRPDTVNRLTRNLRTVHIDTEEYRLYQGRPVAVPKWDLRVPTLVSSIGHFLTDRSEPVDVDTGADIRWVATSDTWDAEYGRWYPTDAGLATTHWWETGQDHEPTYTDTFTYYIGKEEITRSCISFDEDLDQFMWSSLDHGSSSSLTMVVMMVAVLKPVEKNQDFYTVIDSGGEPPPGAVYFDEPWYPDATLVNRTRCRIYPERVQVRYGTESSSTTPDRRPNFGQIGILTMKFDQAGYYAEWYFEEGKFSRYRTVDAKLSNNRFISHNLVLGRENGSVVEHTANMSVFDLNMWTRDPSEKELSDAKNALVSTYGITA